MGGKNENVLKIEKFDEEVSDLMNKQSQQRLKVFIEVIFFFEEFDFDVRGEINSDRLFFFGEIFIDEYDVIEQ